MFLTGTSACIVQVTEMQIRYCELIHLFHLVLSFYDLQIMINDCGETNQLRKEHTLWMLHIDLIVFGLWEAEDELKRLKHVMSCPAQQASS